MKRILSSIAFAVIAASSSLAAAQASDHAAHAAATPSVATSAAPLTEGEVRKVDKESSKLTIRHGTIQNLEMPPMTMVFQVADRAMLDQVKPGDKIRFDADKVGSAFTVTRMEPAN